MFRTLFFLTCLLSLSRLAYADCSLGGCPQGQTCVGMGTFKCVPNRKPYCISYDWGDNPGDLSGLPACPGFGGQGIPNEGPGHSSHAPHEGPDCYADSDCRIGYKCGKGSPDDPNARLSTTPGFCGRTVPACRVDTECLSDEYCEHRLVNNPKGGICNPRSVAAGN
jgi:hypothetical protein